MITAWRLCNKDFAELTGEGARTYGGRWNPKGYFVVYSSECLPLATLEALVHTRRRPNDQVYVELSFEDALVKEVEACTHYRRTGNRIIRPHNRSAQDGWMMIRTRYYRFRPW